MAGRGILRSVLSQTLEAGTYKGSVADWRHPRATSEGYLVAALGQSLLRAHDDSVMSAEAYTVPAGEAPPPPPPFSIGAVCNRQGWMEWVPHLLFGVDLADVGSPAFLAAVSNRVRRLQIQVHPDRCNGKEGLSQ